MTTPPIDFTALLNISIIPLHVPWPSLLSDIKQSGLSYNQQALSIGVQYSTLQRWLGGSEPQFAYGHSILILHASVCGTESTLKRLAESTPMG